jgi:hypothetical protein
VAPSVPNESAAASPCRQRVREIQAKNSDKLPLKHWQHRNPIGITKSSMKDYELGNQENLSMYSFLKLWEKEVPVPED